MTDLVKRLRDEKMGCNLWCEYYDGITPIPLCIEAADRIEKLEAALAHIYAWYPVNVSKPHETIDAIKDYAFAVIKGEIKND